MNRYNLKYNPLYNRKKILDAKLGDELQFTQDGNLYRLSVASQRCRNTECRKYTIKHGTETKNVLETYNWQLDIDPDFRGHFERPIYKQNEIVEYPSRLYKALRNIASGSAFVPDWE